MPETMLQREKIAQAIRILNELQLDCWLLFAAFFLLAARRDGAAGGLPFFEKVRKNNGNNSYIACPDDNNSCIPGNQVDDQDRHKSHEQPDDQEKTHFIIRIGALVLRPAFML